MQSKRGNSARFEGFQRPSLGKKVIPSLKEQCIGTFFRNVCKFLPDHREPHFTNGNLEVVPLVLNSKQEVTVITIALGGEQVSISLQVENK